MNREKVRFIEGYLRNYRDDPESLPADPDDLPLDSPSNIAAHLARKIFLTASGEDDIVCAAKFEGALSALSSVFGVLMREEQKATT